MDWRPMVSRGFGASLEQDTRADFQQVYKSGEIAYYFGRYDEALKFWRPIAEQGFAEAQANLGWMYQAGLGVEKDLGQARRWYVQAVKAKHAVAQNNLAVMFENGLGVKTDYTRAFKLYLQSAKQGYRFAQYNVAQLLKNGLGTERDLQASREWLEKAAEQGVDAARRELQLTSK